MKEESLGSNSLQIHSHHKKCTSEEALSISSLHTVVISIMPEKAEWRIQ